MQIRNLLVEGREQHSFIDKANPTFTFNIDVETPNLEIVEVTLKLNNHLDISNNPISTTYTGDKLQPCKEYVAEISVKLSDGETDSTSIAFETTKLDTPFIAKWISDGAYSFVDKKVSPRPMTFRKFFNCEKKIERARIYMTAWGAYNLYINNQKVGNRYLAPGYTSYKKYLQYQSYDVTKFLTGNDMINVIVSGGWAVGSFVMSRANRLASDKQALLFELYIEYADGSKELIPSDKTFDVTMDGMMTMADIYDGETFDGRKTFADLSYHKAEIFSPRYDPTLIGDYGVGIISHEEKVPEKSFTSKKGTQIYDFGQNFAGVVRLKIKNAKSGQKIVVHHAEILNREGELNLAFLRSAKATATYICRDGDQIYSPTLTYMGFRYISVEGISASDIEVSALVLYSNLREIGSFECSNNLLNRLNKNILWSSKSNLMDIPTDCPQRDERMGWTGDIAVFSPVACYNFDMNNFFEKWLNDMKAEQGKGGGLPNTIPSAGYGFPLTMPVIATDFWGDACVLVPYNNYLSTGNVKLLKTMYPVIKKYVDACAWWAKFLSFGKNRYIWNTLHLLHFGDWVAPDVEKMSEWQKRSKWTATASLRNTSLLLSKIANILGFADDEKYYRSLSNKVADAYVTKLSDGNGKMLNEFQTAYVLPLYFEMFDKNTELKAAENLSNLVKKNEYRIGTGFPGTPYILFALADHGQADTAFKMLLNTKCPSWLHEVIAGGTTIWERWDALNENGECTITDDGTGGMISFNHYASGAVGDFLYKRLLGLEMIEPGYKTFRVKPLLGGNISSCRGEHLSPYGNISVTWKVVDKEFSIDLNVPFMTQCELVMPNNKKYQLGYGKYHYTCLLG